MFAEYGEVQKVFMPKEKGTGKSKGIAFVTMASEEERDAAIEKLNGTECDGRTIYADKAKPRSEKGKQKEKRGLGMCVYVLVVYISSLLVVCVFCLFCPTMFNVSKFYML